MGRGGRGLPSWGSAGQWGSLQLPAKEIKDERFLSINTRDFRHKKTHRLTESQLYGYHKNDHRKRNLALFWGRKGNSPLCVLMT